MKVRVEQITTVFFVRRINNRIRGYWMCFFSRFSVKLRIMICAHDESNKMYEFWTIFSRDKTSERKSQTKSYLSDFYLNIYLLSNLQRVCVCVSVFFFHYFWFASSNCVIKYFSREKCRSGLFFLAVVCSGFSLCVIISVLFYFVLYRFKIQNGCSVRVFWTPDKLKKQLVAE